MTASGPNPNGLCLCGCGQRAPIATRNRTKPWVVKGQPRCYISGHGDKSTHGHARNNNVAPEYRSWQNMIQRCTNPKHHKYKDYGARGITVCERWLTYENFFADMGERPEPKHAYSIEREDNDKGYSPENCKWETRSGQQLNRRKHRDANQSLPIGVRLMNGRFQARVTFKRITTYVGVFDTAEAAVTARNKALRRIK